MDCSGSWADGQDGAAGLAHDPLGHAAHERTAKPRTPMSAERDEIGALATRRPQNLVDRKTLHDPPESGHRLSQRGEVGRERAHLALSQLELRHVGTRLLLLRIVE